MSKFSEWLKHEMNKRNLTQKSIAIEIGINQSQISRYLNEQANPDLPTLLKFAKIWNLPEKEVLEIGGYDENYKRIKKPAISQSHEEISAKNDIQDTLDSKLERIAKEFDTLFLDHLGELDEDSKQKLISYLEFLIQKQDKGLAKKDNTQ